MRLPLFLRVVTVLSLTLTCAALAKPTVDDVQLIGFTHAVSAPEWTIQQPFSPTPRSDRAVLDADALQRGEASNIMIPKSDQTIELPGYTGNYLTPVTKAPLPVLDNKLEKTFITRFAKLRKLTDRVSRIVNPHIRTKNWDITIQPMMPRL